MVCIKEMGGSRRDQKRGSNKNVRQRGKENERLKEGREMWTEDRNKKGSDRTVRPWHIPFDKACWSSESDITPLRSLSTLGRKTQIRWLDTVCSYFTHPHTWTHNRSRHQQSPAETLSSWASVRISTVHWEWMELYDTQGSLCARSSPATAQTTSGSVCVCVPVTAKWKWMLWTQPYK